MEKIAMWFVGVISACSVLFGASMYANREFLLSDLAAAQDDLATYKASVKEELAVCRGEE